MIRKLVALVAPLALLAPFTSTALAAAAPAPHVQTLVLDAIFTTARTAGPGPSHVGHRQIVTGILRDTGGRRIGTFSFMCTWTKVEPAGARERCGASAVTSDGRLDAAGVSQSNSVVHTWGLTGGSGRYRDASGQATVRDLGDREALLSLAVRTADGGALHAGTVSRPAANHAFIAQADGACRRAATALASLPPFPFKTFEPLHPDPSMLPDVGAFFTGPGDPRSILRGLENALHALGQPPRQGELWRLAMRARDHELAIIDEQDRAALAGDVPAFVRSVHHSAENFRQIAITETAFGSTRCVL